MSLDAELSRDGGTLLVRVPLKRRWRGARRLMIAANRAALPEPPPSHADADPILKALGRAWRWKCLLESESYASLGELAAEERMHKSYLSRLLRLTLLSPSITEAILDGKLSKDVLLDDLIGSMVADWGEQDRHSAKRDG